MSNLFKHQTTFLIALVIACALPILVQFFKLNFEAIIGLMCFPFVLTSNGNLCKSHRFVWVTVIFVALYFFTGIMTAIYFAAGFLIFYVLEQTKGKVKWPALALLFIISPFFNYIVKLLSFPLRLHLTALAVKILSALYPNLQANGNVIQNGEHVFSVDPECMGLNLIVFSLSIGLVILVHFEKKAHRNLRFHHVALAVLAILTLANLGNLLRIILLVLFQSKPNSLSHELIGLVALIAYTLTPYYILVRYLLKSKNNNLLAEKRQTKPISKKALVLFSACLTALILVGFVTKEGKHVALDEKYNSINIEGFQKTIVNANIMKFENNDALVYIKPPVGFYGADHSPKICWTGSGYKIKNQKEIIVNNVVVQSAELVAKNGDRLFTSWWFDNGEHKTGLQLSWRANSFKGAAPYRLMNVTTAANTTTTQLTKVLLRQNLFNM